MHAYVKLWCCSFGISTFVALSAQKRGTVSTEHFPSSCWAKPLQVCTHALPVLELGNSQINWSDSATKDPGMSKNVRTAYVSFTNLSCFSGALVSLSSISSCWKHGNVEGKGIMKISLCMESGTATMQAKQWPGDGVFWATRGRCSTSLERKVLCNMCEAAWCCFYTQAAGWNELEKLLCLWAHNSFRALTECWKKCLKKKWEKVTSTFVQSSTVSCKQYCSMDQKCGCETPQLLNRFPVLRFAALNPSTTSGINPGFHLPNA